MGNNINQYSWRRTRNWPSLISYQTSCVHCLRFFLSLIFWTRVAVLTLSDLCLLISTYRNTSLIFSNIHLTLNFTRIARDGYGAIRILELGFLHCQKVYNIKVMCFVIKHE